VTTEAREGGDDETETAEAEGADAQPRESADDGSEGPTRKRRRGRRGGRRGRRERGGEDRQTGEQGTEERPALEADGGFAAQAGNGTDEAEWGSEAAVPGDDATPIAPLDLPAADEDREVHRGSEAPVPVRPEAASAYGEDSRRRQTEEAAPDAAQSHLAEDEADGNQPKRSGWWQRRSFF
jgi:ribonuclease E